MNSQISPVAGRLLLLILYGIIDTLFRVVKHIYRLGNPRDHESKIQNISFEPAIMVR